jgi:5-formyltetrahydrofolate cyclo-ligase
VDAELAAAKRRLRDRLVARRRAVTPETAQAAARAVTEHLCAEAAVVGAARVGLYAALPDELPTRPVFEALAASAVLLLPRLREQALEFAPVARWEDLQPGRYGILEPAARIGAVALAEGDVVLVPGVAFDRAGNRLGRGGGFYDRALPGGAGSPLRIGVAYDFQLVDSVPHDSRDRPVDAIVTERELCFMPGRK